MAGQGGHADSDPGPGGTATEIWEWRDPRPSGNFLRSVAYGKNLFVVAGSGGNILWSRDGISWSSRNLGTCLTFKTVLFAADRFVVAGDSGILFTSEDGLAWRRGNSPPTIDKEGLTSIAYGNGTFVAVGWAGAVRVSTDAISWSAHHAGIHGDIRTIAFGDGRFVCATYGKLYHSQDGLDWREGVAEKESEEETVVANRIYHVNGKFLAMGYAAGRSQMRDAAYSSEDGRTWIRMGLGVDGCLVKSPIPGDTGLLALPTRSADDEIRAFATSPDGVSWEWVRTDRPIPGLAAFAEGGGTLVGVGYPHRIYISQDARTWKRAVEVESVLGGKALHGIAYGEQGFVVSTGSDTLFASKDAVAWNRQIVDMPSSFPKVIHGKGCYVVIGRTGGDYGILASRDALHWRRTQPLPAHHFLPTLHAEGKHVSVGDFGRIYLSEDLESWHRCESGTTEDLLDLAHGGGRFVAVGENGILLASEDGEEWSLRNTGTTHTLHAVAYGAGRFKAVGGDGVILTSADGLAWVRDNSRSSNHLQGIAYGKGEFVGVGSSGIMTYKVGGEGERAGAEADHQDGESIIGIWAKDDFSEFRLGSIDSSADMAFSDPIIPRPEAGFSYPVFPQTAEALDAFRPSGWTVLSEAAGDLDRDGSADRAMLLQSRKSLLVADRLDLIRKPTVLAILFQEGQSDRFVLAEQSRNFLSDTLEPGRICPPPTVAISEGVLEVGLSKHYHANRSFTDSLAYRFRFDGTAFVLIASDHLGYTRYRTAPPVARNYDYLSGMVKTTTGGDEAFPKDSVAWSEIRYRKIIGLRDIEDALSWKVEGERGQ